MQNKATHTSNSLAKQLMKLKPGELLRGVPVDEKTGIRHAKAGRVGPNLLKLLFGLGVRESSHSPSNPYEIHVAEVHADRITPHIHFTGSEPYVILSGEGRMHIGSLVDGNSKRILSIQQARDEKSASVRWETPIPLSKGVAFTINEGQVHSLEAISKPLVIAFICPPSHLDDSRDRFIIRLEEI